MIILSADNRSLLTVSSYTYIVDNLPSGESSLRVTNATDFEVNDLILLGQFGNEDAEIFRIGSVNTSTGVLTLLDKNGNADTTAFPHTESTRVTVIPFNEIRFYWTPATGTIADENPVFNTSTPLTAWEDISPSGWFTTHQDATHSSGFGWFLFRNSISLEASQSSNAIPYTGFGTNSVQYIFDDFMSLINNRELKLVTQPDMFSWLNEGLALIYNKLNLTSTEYMVSVPQTITILSGVSEYLLPNDFGDLVQITNGGIPMDWISLPAAMSYTGTTSAYYIRGRYIGFVPVPSGTSNILFRYRSKGHRLTSLDDAIDLPDNGAFVLKDWMMWRAYLKFQNPNAQVFYKSFTDGMNQLIVSSIQRDANLDRWGIEHSSIA